MFQAQKTQRLGFQIRFGFLAITHAFLVRFSSPAPVLNSELRCGSNGILQWVMGWVWTELYRVKVNRANFSSYTVLLTTQLYKWMHVQINLFYSEFPNKNWFYFKNWIFVVFLKAFFMSESILSFNFTYTVGSFVISSKIAISFVCLISFDLSSKVSFVTKDFYLL